MKKEIEEQNNEKEDQSLEKWIPIGVMIGTAAGAILSIIFNNILFLGGGSGLGLLLGVMIGSIVHEENEEKDKNEK